MIEYGALLRSHNASRVSDAPAHEHIQELGGEVGLPGFEQLILHDVVAFAHVYENASKRMMFGDLFPTIDLPQPQELLVVDGFLNRGEFMIISPG